MERDSVLYGGKAVGLQIEGVVSCVRTMRKRKYE